MTSDISNKRDQVKAVYGCHPSWTGKVDRMSDDQLIAVFLRLSQSGKIK